MELTFKTLAKLGLNIAKKEWSLKGADTKIYIDEIIRILPKKRLVAFADWGHQKVVVKLFFEKGEAKRDALLDATGTRALLEANVPTPKLLYEGCEDKKRIYILIYERIINAVSFLDIWQNKTSVTALLPLLRTLIVEIATQHVLGILQKDLHLNNFLVTEKCIYTLDGGQITKINHPLDEERSLEYLCLLLAQLGVGVQDTQYELFKYYANLRGWIIKPKHIKKFKKKLSQISLERSMRYRKKIFRTSSQIKRVNKLTRTMLYDRSYESPQFLKLLENPETIFANPTTMFLKKGRSSTVAKVVIDDRTLVIKRYNLKSGWHRMRRLFRHTRAQKSWCMAQHLFASGIKTAKPVAYIENRFLGFRGTSYFVMDYVDGPHIGEYFRAKKENLTQLQNMAKAISTLIINLSLLRITHGDLKMTNILVENDLPVLIDLDGIKEHTTQKSLHNALKSEIKRFMKNWDHYPNVALLFQHEFYEKN
jgi:tRNA A-37 threonylcarbamoyl transferase component Bud32